MADSLQTQVGRIDERTKAMQSDLAEIKNWIDKSDERYVSKDTWKTTIGILSGLWILGVTALGALISKMK